MSVRTVLVGRAKRRGSAQPSALRSRGVCAPRPAAKQCWLPLRTHGIASRVPLRRIHAPIGVSAEPGDFPTRGWEGVRGRRGGSALSGRVRWAREPVRTMALGAFSPDFAVSSRGTAVAMVLRDCWANPGSPMLNENRGCGGCVEWLLGTRGGRDRVGACWGELSNHLVEAWFLATAKARDGLSRRVDALRALSFSRRRRWRSRR